MFIVNVLAFVLMGLQARRIIERLSPDELWKSLFIALGVLTLVIVVRIAWIVIYRLVLAVVRQHSAPLAHKLGPRSPRGSVVIAWSGMRGLVTLATAFALPENFPYRDLILFVAFTVVLGSLVIQGVTLRPLIHTA